MIFALFSGTILAKMQADRNISAGRFISSRSLSTATFMLVIMLMSLRSTYKFSRLYSPFAFFWSKTPLILFKVKFCFFPSTTNIFQFELTIPARRAVSTAIKIPSPVIILQSISAYFRHFMVQGVSYFNSFSKVTNPIRLEFYIIFYRPQVL